MLIDWFTVGAQALNFFILVWLLKRFLYQPILNAIDAREKGIAAQLAQADAKKAEATDERDQFQRKNAEFDQERAALLHDATSAAHAQRTQLQDDARHAADALRAQRQAALRSEHQHLQGEIGRMVSEEAFAIARKMLQDLSGVALEERIVDVFVQRLLELKKNEQTDFVKALQRPAATALVRSAFVLPKQQQKAIRQALVALSDAEAEAEIRIEFEIAPALISGVEVSVNGQKVSWSTHSHLGELEKSVAQLLKAPASASSSSSASARPDAQPQPQPVAGATASPAAAATVLESGA
jgi:F-type H+-transporting ATPase subunit b